MILYHNKARACIALGPRSDVCRKYGVISHQQPKASDMIEMKWDDDLAVIAQQWANNCEFKHDTGAQRKDSRFAGVGQNIATTYSTVDDGGKKDAKEITRLWFDEHKDYKYSPVKIDAHFFKIGHYTQMVWANTQFVGCGFSYYKKEDGFFHKLFVCNYGPSGNYIGQYPYSKGNPSCQSFGLSTSNTKGLCKS
ncbi:salivary antigen-5-like isoform X2 [Lycorma delicatula]